jgi:AmmeMemoRadiSam system protein A
LRRIAVNAIEHGFSGGGPFSVAPGSYPDLLAEPGAVFVTLKSGGRLRGCIGSTVARRSLAEDVASNAYAAAFQDPRFRPLRPEELQRLEIHISLLTPQVPVEAKTREELLKSLRPGIDGLLLEDPPHRATFLPQVWEALPQPSAFLEELFLKAGLPRNHWSGSLRFSRYTVEEI